MKTSRWEILVRRRGDHVGAAVRWRGTFRLVAVLPSTSPLAPSSHSVTVAGPLTPLLPPPLRRRDLGRCGGELKAGVQVMAVAEGGGHE